MLQLRLLAAAIFAAALILPARADGESPPFRLEEAVSQAIRHNLGLSAVARDVVAARFEEKSAGSLANPEFLFTPGVTSLSGTGEELLIQQPLELNGARSARTDIARAHTRAARAEAVIELRRLVFSTKTAFLELARARELRALSAESLKTSEELHRIALRQVEIGTRPGVERTQTAIEVSRARQQLENSDGQVRSAAAALNTLMGRAPETPLPELAALDSKSATAEREASVTQALGSRAEIALLEAGREGFVQEGRLAKAEGRPDVTLQARSGSVVRGFRDTGLGIGITLPLFDHGRRRNKILKAEEEAKAQDDRIAAARNQVRGEVEQSLARLTAAQAVVKDYLNGALENARKVLESHRTGFRTGATSITAVLEAQRTYRSVVAGYTDALVEQALAQADLERAIGAVPAELLPHQAGVAKR